MLISRRLLSLSLAASLAASAHGATLVYTNDVMGELEPCGCRSNPLGGMVRKANFVAKLRSKDSELLQLDAGDLLFETNLIPGPLEKQAKLQASYQLKAHELLGHDAIVPGEKDFALGVKVFEELRKKTKIQFLAANLKKKKGGSLLEPHAIFTRKVDGKPLKIAVIGLVGTDLGWPAELKAESPIEAAKLEVAALKAKRPDLIIALTHQGLEADRALAKAVPAIAIIVGGHSQSFLQNPITIGKTVIYQSSFRNQYVGAIDLHPQAEPQLVGMDAGYDDAAGTSSKMAALVAEMKAQIAELNAKEEAKLTRAEPGANPHAQKFQTFARCAECHLKQFDFWRRTPHAHALTPLVEAKQDKNKACLNCHTVGLSDPSGFSNVSTLGELVDSKAWKTEDLHPFLESMSVAKNLKSEVKLTRAEPALPLRDSLARITKAWTPVQCENCHAPGFDHPFSGSYSKTVATDACLKCHTQERAPQWYTSDGKADMQKIETKRKQITCPAGELPPEEL